MNHSVPNESSDPAAQSRLIQSTSNSISMTPLLVHRINWRHPLPLRVHTIYYLLAVHSTYWWCMLPTSYTSLLGINVFAGLNITFDGFLLLKIRSLQPAFGKSCKKNTMRLWLPAGHTMAICSFQSVLMSLYWKNYCTIYFQFTIQSSQLIQWNTCLNELTKTLDSNLSDFTSTFTNLRVAMVSLDLVWATIFSTTDNSVEVMWCMDMFCYCV